MKIETVVMLTKTKCTLRETSTTSASWTSRTTSTWKTRTTSSAIGHLCSLKQGSVWQRGSEHVGQLAVGEGALQAQHSILWDFVGLHIFNSQSSEILRGYDNYTIISGNPRTFSKQVSDSNFLKLALRAKNEAYGGIKRKILLFRLLALGFVSVSQFSGISNFYGGNKVQILVVDFKTSIFLVDPCACNVYLTTSSYSLQFSRTRVLFSRTTDWHLTRPPFFF